MPSKKPLIAIRTTQEIIDEFNRICELEDRSMSNMGERLIKQFIKEYQATELNADLEDKSENFKSSNYKIG